MKITRILPLAALSLLTGCMALSVPRTTIAGKIGGQPFTLSSPKDSTITNLDIVAGTNGTVSIHLGSLQATMNPAVITTTGQQEASIISAVANGITGALGTAAGAALNSAATGGAAPAAGAAVKAAAAATTSQ